MNVPISLQEVLSAIGGPLQEKSLWALLYLGKKIIQDLKNESGKGVPLLISPESMLFYHGGSVKFLQGIPAETSKFTAPEHFGTTNEMEFSEKSYIYSLGITLFTAMEYGLDGKSPDISEEMNSLLSSMIEQSVEQRSSLTQIDSICQNCSSVETAEEEVDMLVSYIFGPSHELSSSEYGETDLDDANLETEFQEAITIKGTKSVEQLYSPSYGSRTSSSLSLNSSGIYHKPRSLGSYDNLYSSLPAVYYHSNEDQLSLKVTQHSSRNWSSFDRLDSRLQPSEVELLAGKTKNGRQHSTNRKYGTHLYTPTRARKPLDNDKPSLHQFYRTSSDNQPKVQRLLPKQPELQNDNTPSNQHHVISATPPLSDEEPVISATPPLSDEEPVISATPPLSNEEPVISATPPLSEEEPVISATLPLSDEEPVNSATPPLSEEEPVISATPPLSNEEPVISATPPLSDEEPVISATPPSNDSTPIASSLCVDDMPPLPPPMIVTQLSHEDHVIHDEAEGLDFPPPLPSNDPPVFDDDACKPSLTDNTFDYSQLNTSFNSQANKTRDEDDFEFSFPEAPPPPTPGPPQDDIIYQEELDASQEGDKEPTTSPRNNEPTTSPGDKEPSTIQGDKEPSAIQRDKEPTTSRGDKEPFAIQRDKEPATSLGDKELAVSPGDQEPSSIQRDKEPATSLGDKELAVSHKKKQLEYSITPRRALDEAFDELDRLSSSSDMNRSTEELTTPLESEIVDSVYSKVNAVSQKKYTDKLDRNVTPRTALVQAFQDLDKIGESHLDNNSDLSDEEGKSPSGNEVDDLYAKVDINKKKSNSPPTASHNGIHRASSVDTVPGPDYAIVHHPKRSSMPPNSLPDTKYEEVAPPIPPQMMDCETNGSLREYSSNGSSLDSNKTSLKKLSTVFGPEFESFSGVGSKKVKMIRQMPDGRRAVKVVLLNGQSTLFTVERDSLCRDLFQQVVAHQGLHEKKIFGLAILRDRDEIFLEFDSKLSKYAPSGWAHQSSKSRTAPVFTMFFRVKFYVENVSELNSSHARHLYYLQLRKDILEGKMYCHEQPALKLAALALQAEKGDVPTKLQHAYFRMEDYVPIKCIDRLGRPYLESLLPTMHSEHKGLGKEMAELEFLKIAQKLPEYGMVFYRVANTKRGSIGSVWLGFSVRGIVVFDIHKDIKTPVKHCPWKDIENLSFSNRKFIVELEGTKPLPFYTNSYKKARHLLHLSMSYHRFQLLTRGLLIDHQESSDASSPPTSAIKNDDCALYDEPQLKLPDCIEVRLLKGLDKELGINICASPTTKFGSNIIVEEIVKDGPAHLDGKLMKGDVLLSVNGVSLQGKTCQETAEILKEADDLVVLKAHRQIQSAVNVSSHYYAELSEPSSPAELSPAHITQLPPAHVTQLPPAHVTQLSPPQATVLEVNEPIVVSINDTSTVESDDNYVDSFEGTSKSENGTEMASHDIETHIGKVSKTMPDGLPDGTTTVMNIEKVDGIFGVKIAGGVGKAIGRGFIYVKSIVENSPAQKCNQLEVNDIFLEVNGSSLMQTTHREAAAHIQKAQGIVHVRVHRPFDSGWIETDSGMMNPIRESWSDTMTQDTSSTQKTAELAPIIEHDNLPIVNNEPSLELSTVVSDGSNGLDDVFIGENDVLCSVSEPHLLSSSHGEHDTSSTPDELETTLSETALSYNSHEVTDQLKEIGVFIVTLKKGFRGLGFMLDKSLSGQQERGVFVMKVNDDPAKKDGRLKQGDEIIQVNDVYLVGKSHKEAITVIREAQGTVTLYVRREDVGPPSLPHSPLPTDVELNEGTNGVFPVLNGASTDDDSLNERVLLNTRHTETPPLPYLEQADSEFEEETCDPVLTDAYPPLPDSPLPLEDD